MRFGLDIAQQRLEWDEIAGRAKFAETLGFEGVWGFDHFQPMYGEGPGNCFEGWTTLAALAGVTERVRLGLLVTGYTYRHPSLLASEVITVDHVSHGRVDLSLGAAWFEGEHRALGFDFPPTGERIEGFEEALQVIELLMTEDDVSFSGKHFRLDHATMRPRPVQQPHPPIWIGAGGERKMLPIAARHADVWHSFGSVEDLTRKSARLDELALEYGRDPDAIERATSLSLDGSDDEVAAQIDAWTEAGFDHLIVGWPATGRPRIEQFASRFL
ncbi:MAG: class F420-dependent oxidoreductase [Actinomycetia bacterium]|nr:class F420-dependent oxidoreductase [Actinomycetes bacterium]